VSPVKLAVFAMFSDFFSGIQSIVLSDGRRAIPSLNRGWRTPDPSPTRDAAGLPKCMSPCYTASETIGTVRRPEHISSTPRLQLRTPSPEPWMDSEGCSTCSIRTDLNLTHLAIPHESLSNTSAEKDVHVHLLSGESLRVKIKVNANNGDLRNEIAKLRDVEKSQVRLMGLDMVLQDEDEVPVDILQCVIPEEAPLSATRRRKTARARKREQRNRRRGTSIDKTHTRICKDWRDGCCTRAECTYAHGEENLRLRRGCYHEPSQTEKRWCVRDNAACTFAEFWRKQHSGGHLPKHSRFIDKTDAIAFWWDKMKVVPAEHGSHMMPVSIGAGGSSLMDVMDEADLGIALSSEQTQQGWQEMQEAVKAGQLPEGKDLDFFLSCPNCDIYND
jgi:hypothetical protein